MSPEEIKKTVEADGSKLEEIVGGAALSADDFENLLLGLACLMQKADQAMREASKTGNLPLFLSAAVGMSEAVSLHARLSKISNMHKAASEAAAAKRACEQSNIDPRWTGVPPQGNA